MNDILMFLQAVIDGLFHGGILMLLWGCGFYVTIKAMKELVNNELD